MIKMNFQPVNSTNYIDPIYPPGGIMPPDDPIEPFPLEPPTAGVLPPREDFYLV